MHDIWNPWHGCIKCSEGCDHCYMYFLDRMRELDGSHIYKTKSGFRKPVQKDRQGRYKIQSGETVRVCMTSDFFLEEADPWREEAWNLIRQRRDVIFFFLLIGETDGIMYFLMLPVKISAELMSEFQFCWSCLLNIKELCALRL